MKWYIINKQITNAKYLQIQQVPCFCFFLLYVHYEKEAKFLQNRHGLTNPNQGEQKSVCSNNYASSSTTIIMHTPNQWSLPLRGAAMLLMNSSNEQCAL